MSGHHIIPANQKLMKIWKFTLRKSSGVKNTLRQNLSLQSFSGKSLRKWNPATQSWGSPTREHHKQHRNPHARCVFPSPQLHQFRHDIQQQAIPKLQPDSRTLLAHLHKKFLFRGTWRLIEMAKWVLAEPTTDTVSAWMKWSPHAGSHFSQTFHGIATLDYQLMVLHA